MNVDLQEQTRKLLEEPLLGEQDVDAKIRRLLEAEYMRRLVQYRRVDRNLRQKYGTTFEEFMTNRVVQQEGYTWEAETDAMDWETAVGGIETMRRKLQELQHVQQD
ncbi:MAG: hypothetical protein R6X31_01750 [Anaerolineae bacterium]